jgi:hypothetical protein
MSPISDPGPGRLLVSALELLRIGSQRDPFHAAPRAVQRSAAGSNMRKYGDASMKRTTMVVVALAVAACLGSATAAPPDDTQSRDDSRNSGKNETIRGVIAAVTIEGETTVDFTTHRPQAAEMSFLTIVGHRTGEHADKTTNREETRDSSMRRRHNVYNVWLTPRTKIRDATSTGNTKVQSNKNREEKLETNEATLDKVEVGDVVEVTFQRREPSSGAAAGEHAQWMRKHGRNRVFFGDALSISILALPSPDRDASRSDSNFKDPHRDKSNDGNKN